MPVAHSSYSIAIGEDDTSFSSQSYLATEKRPDDMMLISVYQWGRYPVGGKSSPSGTGILIKLSS